MSKIDVETTDQKALTLRQGAAALYDVMGRRRRLQLALTMVLMVAGAVAELVTIGAVIPLLALAADPGYFAGNPAVQSLVARIGLSGGGGLIVPAAIFLVIAAFLSAILRSALSWMTYHFVYGLGYDIATRVYARMLRQPYEHYVKQNSSVSLAAVQKIYSVVVGIAAPAILAFTSSVIAVCIITFFFVIDPATAAFASVSIGIVYVGISLVSRRALLSTSRRLTVVHTERLKAVQESWGGMRDIILDQSQPIFERRLAGFEAEMRRLWASSNFIAESPRFIVESFGITVVAMLAVYFSLQPGGVLAGIPVLGAFALGAQRLLPLVQSIYRAWASYSVNAHILRDVVHLMNIPVSKARPADAQEQPLPALPDIELEDIWFNYSSDEEVLKGISLRIRPGERVAFIGRTGSGKSTLVDVLMGLLTPTKGTMRLGGVLLDDTNVVQWQRRIAHVPQSIFLSDDTIAANIAFGSNPDQIDMDRIHLASERAGIRNFIDQLPEGFSTRVGERGIRLSGGQRQRIGIARALYKKASVLVLDEATSALDSQTEAAIMDSVAGLGAELTIILIAHRLSTLSGCDVIYRMDEGMIVQAAGYEEIVGSSASVA